MTTRGTSFPCVPFEALFAQPQRNGVYKPKEFHGRGVRLVNMGELFEFDFLGAQPMKRIELNERELATSLLEAGDLLFARRSLVLEGSGKCSLIRDVPEPTTFESSIIRVRLRRDDANPWFYHYFFRAPQGRAAMASIATRTAVSGITGTNLARLPVPRPPRALQDRIVDVLSAYDDLIENNAKRIEILEEMARSLFREWFVNFRFPGHEKVKRVASPIGEAPEAWRVVPVNEAVEINPRTQVPSEGEKPFVPMGGLSHSSMLIEDIEVREGNSGAKFRNGDTLFARITPCLENGKTGYVQFLPDDEAVAFGSTELVVLREKLLTREMVYLLARSGSFRSHAIKSMTGASGRQRVQDRCFDTYLVAVPPRPLSERFTEAVRPMFTSVHALARKSRNLRATRDLLLPRLISGELDVSGIEARRT